MRWPDLPEWPRSGIIRSFSGRSAGFWYARTHRAWHRGFLTLTAIYPVADILLQPEGDFVPNLSHTESVVVVPRRYFEYNKGADLGDVFRFFDEGDLGAQFHVGEAEGARSRPAGQVNRIVRRENTSRGKYGVQFHSWNSTPVELQGGPGGVDFGGCAIDTAKDIELVVM